MNEPLALEDIAGLSLTMIGVLVEEYVKQGYADPTMYRALKGAEQLAEHYKARIEYDNGDTELVEALEDMITNFKVVAMECGEVVNRMIEEHGFPIDKHEWSE